VPAITAEYIVKRALRPLGVVGGGQPMKATDANDGRDSLNDMISTWRTKTLTIPYEAITRYSLISGQQDYTLGPGGDFDQVRPTYLRGIGLILMTSANQTELPLQILTPQQWPFVTIKLQQSTFPTGVYPQMTYPLITLHFWPKPTQANDVRIYWKDVMSSFADLTTQYDVPEGYPEALIYNLTKRLAPDYGFAMTQDLMTLAQDSLMNIAGPNLAMDILTVDRGIRGTPAIYDWRTDNGASGGGGGY
jgi:hypothetical protein